MEIMDIERQKGDLLCVLQPFQPVDGGAVAVVPGGLQAPEQTEIDNKQQVGAIGEITNKWMDRLTDKGTIVSAPRN